MFEYSKKQKILGIVSILLLAYLLWSLPANAASQCKGLEKNVCITSEKCFWKEASEYNRKAYSYKRGDKTINVAAKTVKVKPHCRTSRKKKTK